MRWAATTRLVISFHMPIGWKGAASLSWGLTDAGTQAALADEDSAAVEVAVTNLVRTGLLSRWPKERRRPYLLMPDADAFLRQAYADLRETDSINRPMVQVSSFWLTPLGRSFCRCCMGVEGADLPA